MFQSFEQNITLMNALRLSKLVPVNPSGEPVKVSAGTVPPDPLKLGAPEGHATVPAGVNGAVPLFPAGVNEAVPFVGTPAGQAIVPAGVPPDTDWERATAAEVALAVPVALTAVAAREVPVPNVAMAIWRMVVVDGICHGSS